MVLHLQHEWIKDFSVYLHSTGLVATNFFQSINMPCLLYTDDRHNGQLLVPLDKGAYLAILFLNRCRFTAAQSTLCVIAYHLVCFRYFLGLAKSILNPKKVVPFLRILLDSSLELYSRKEIKVLVVGP